MAFVALEKLIHLHEGYQQTFQVAGLNVMLIHHHGKDYLIEPVCPHAGWSLMFARSKLGRITCPKHNFVFRIDTGEIVSPYGMNCQPLKTYPPAYHGNEVGLWI